MGNDNTFINILILLIKQINTLSLYVQGEKLGYVQDRFLNEYVKNSTLVSLQAFIGLLAFLGGLFSLILICPCFLFFILLIMVLGLNKGPHLRQTSNLPLIYTPNTINTIFQVLLVLCPGGVGWWGT